MSKLDPVELNVEGVRQLVTSGLNKVVSASSQEGENGELIDEFSIDIDDSELLAIAQKWEANYLSYEAKIKTRQEANRTYYLGLQNMGGADVSSNISANLLFEAEETFLPAALSKNPEPVVWTDNTEEGNILAKSVKTMLQYHADTLVLRRKLTLLTRHWSIYFLGCIKHGWDTKIDDIRSDVINPQTLILDPDGYIDSFGDYVGDYIGERKSVSATELIELFPKSKNYITILVDGLLGSKVTYTEWWNDEYVFYTFKDIILDKKKNPYYNYDGEEEGVDEDGEVAIVTVHGRNHFGRPKKPYTFLSVFTLETQPHDLTGLIEQNIPNQNRITRRTKQIDTNISRANNSMAFSMANFNQETGKQAATALENGDPILIPQGGPTGSAIIKLDASEVPQSAFNDLEISKNDLRTIFGTQGITAQQQDEDQTARGMILNQSFDNSRIGGGIGDALEQVSDNIFNWWTQLYYVFYDEAHTASIMGKMKAVDYITLQSIDLDRKIVISVVADSMKPKDEVTEMNQALALWDKGAIDPKTLLTILNFPDPQQTAENTVLWLVDQQAYMQINFPELAAKIMGAQPVPPPMGGGPAPEEVTEPPPGLSVPLANPSLSEVPLN